MDLKDLRLVIPYMLFGCNTLAAADWTFDAGLGLTNLQVGDDLTAAENELRPAVFLGFHQFATDNWRIGTSVDWLVEDPTSWGRSTNVLYWRIADIDYRITDNLAINAHGGITRYFREQSSYGPGYGAGLKYRFAQNWYVAAEVTVSDVDTSTGVPVSDGHAQTKNELTWTSLRINRLF